MADFAEARIKHERGHVDEAVKMYDEILNSQVGKVNHEVLFFYGTALYQQGKVGLAATVLKQCIDARPTFQSAFQNLGNCYRWANDHKGAEEIYKCGLELGPSADLEACLAGLWINRGNPQKALYHYERSLAIEPRDDLVRFNMGFAYLEMGDWKKGWPLYDLGYITGARTPRQYLNLPIWQGEQGKTLIVWGEQGLGDEIMFASLLPDLQKISKRVIFDCHPRLVNTFKRSFPEVEIHGTRKNYNLEWVTSSDADAHCSVTTAAMYLRNDDKDFPGTPYLIPSAGIRKPRTNRLRVGVTWSGGTRGTHAHARSFPVQTLLPILEQDCDFFSLQYQPTAAREVCELEEQEGIHLKHYPSRAENPNYDETISFISTLDLVITVCTTVHHAANALGVPCWTMVPSEPAWRYGQSGTKTIWYKNAVLYRQRKGETWEPTIERVAKDLSKLLKSREKVAA
jgi:tetratricopeptide (TPR) repeat protein